MMTVLYLRGLCFEARDNDSSGPSPKGRGCVDTPPRTSQPAQASPEQPPAPLTAFPAGKSQGTFQQGKLTNGGN